MIKCVDFLHLRELRSPLLMEKFNKYKYENVLYCQVVTILLRWINIF